MARPYITTATKQAVIHRADGRCEYCQSRADYATETFAVEHIIPISRGGSDELDNLALACSGCNGYKYNHLEASDPAENKLVTLFHPRQQRWSEHFQWSEDFTQIVGITPTGRATVNALRLNRTGVVNMRALLFEVGKHPPQLD